MLTLLSFVIQTLIPVTIVINLETPDGLCPNQVDPMGKTIGVALALFFVVLTINICLSKMLGICFLKLFCTEEVKLLGCNRFYLDLAILSNMFAFVVWGVAQYLLFIRNANEDYVLLLLESLAMQFVLTPDVRFMTGPWRAWTKGRLETLLRHEEDRLVALQGDVEGASDQGKDLLSILVKDNKSLIKVKFFKMAEAIFLGIFSTVGVAWAIALGCCM